MRGRNALGGLAVIIAHWSIRNIYSYTIARLSSPGVFWGSEERGRKALGGLANIIAKNEEEDR